jgi:hypothetical protein
MLELGRARCDNCGHKLGQGRHCTPIEVYNDENHSGLSEEEIREVSEMEQEIREDS